MRVGQCQVYVLIAPCAYGWHGASCSCCELAVCVSVAAVEFGHVLLHILRRVGLRRGMMRVMANDVVRKAERARVLSTVWLWSLLAPLAFGVVVFAVVLFAWL